MTCVSQFFIHLRFFQVIPNSGRDLFSIHDRTGAVTLTHKLNYTSLSTFYRLKIVASVSIWQIE